LPASCSFVLDSNAIDEGSCFAAQLLAASFYESARTAFASGRMIHAPITLSPLERKCLEFAALRMTDWRISERLKISESAVQMHVRHAMHLFGAPTRELAVARALALRQIQFGDIQRADEVNESKIAHEAAYWLMRLDEADLHYAAHPSYARWLAEPPAHAEAMRFLQSFCNSLRESNDFLSRDQLRMH
jgi:DNA-binding CsgD family transcriptional regulator